MPWIDTEFALAAESLDEADVTVAAAFAIEAEKWLAVASPDALVEAVTVAGTATVGTPNMFVVEQAVTVAATTTVATPGIFVAEDAATVAATVTVGAPNMFFVEEAATVAAAVTIPGVPPVVITGTNPNADVSGVTVAGTATVGTPNMFTTEQAATVAATTTVGTAVVQFSRAETFEGTDEANIGTNDLWFTGGVAGSGTVKYDTAYFIDGASSMRIVTTDGTTINKLAVFGRTTKMYQSIYWRTDDPTPTTTHTIMSAQPDTGSDAGSFRLVTTGALRLCDQVSAFGDTSALTVAANTWYRFDWTYDIVAQTQTVDIFTGANLHGLTADETLSTSINGNGQGLTYTVRWRMGVISGAGSGHSQWWDAGAYSNVSMPAPRGGVTNATVTAATVAGTATVGAPTFTSSALVVLGGIALPTTVGAVGLAKTVATVSATAVVYGPTVLAGGDQIIEAEPAVFTFAAPAVVLSGVTYGIITAESPVSRGVPSGAGKYRRFDI